MTPTFAICQQTIPATSKPWFIVETYHTSDGHRCRICDGRWKTFNEAQSFVEMKLSNARNAEKNNDANS